MTHDHDKPEFDQVLAEGRFLRFGIRNGWEYALRKGISGIVGIVAVTKDRRLVLVEQYRPPLDARVIELPAGLVGDEAGSESEEILDGARRELREETGYEAGRWEVLCQGPVAPGSLGEVQHLVFAGDLRKVGPGGGEAGEDLEVHEVPLSEIDGWLRGCEDAGLMIDLKVYSGLCFVRERPDRPEHS